MPAPSLREMLAMDWDGMSDAIDGLANGRGGAQAALAGAHAPQAAPAGARAAEVLLGPGAARFALPEAGVLAASEAQLRAACENGATDSATMEPLEEALAAGVPLALTRSVGGSVATAHLAASLAAWALRSKVDGAGREYGEPNGCDPVSRLPLSAVQVEAVARFARSGGAVASEAKGQRQLVLQR